jgi:spermidine synthase
MNGLVTKNKIDRAVYSLLYIGFGSIISQILLIREFIVSFYGNELSIGVILAGWLIWIGIGSAAGNRILKTNLNTSRCFFFLIAFTPVVTFIQITAVKLSRSFVYAAAGEFLSIAKLIGFSFTILCFGCLLWGILFTLGAKLLSSEKEQMWFGVNRTYVLDSIGCAAGGLLFSFVLVPFFTTLQIVLFLHLCAWSLTVWQFFKNKKIAGLAGVTVLVILFCVLFKPINRLEHQINACQWSLINDRLEFIR